jgi:hypothetical protein
VEVQLHHFEPWHKMKASGQFHDFAALSPRKQLLHPLHRRLSGPKNQSGHHREEKARLLLPGIKPELHCHENFKFQGYFSFSLDWVCVNVESVTEEVCSGGIKV